MHIDESTLLWAAALVDEIDPAELVDHVDVAALAAIVAHAGEVVGLLGPNGAG